MFKHIRVALAGTATTANAPSKVAASFITHIPRLLHTRLLLSLKISCRSAIAGIIIKGQPPLVVLRACGSLRANQAVTFLDGSHFGIACRTAEKRHHTLHLTRAFITAVPSFHFYCAIALTGSAARWRTSSMFNRFAQISQYKALDRRSKKPPTAEPCTPNKSYIHSRQLSHIKNSTCDVIPL